MDLVTDWSMSDGRELDLNRSLIRCDDEAVTAVLPSELQRGLHQVAVGLIHDESLDVGAAIAVAEALVVAGYDAPMTVEVASLPRRSIRSDVEPMLRQMLAEYGLVVPPVGTREERYEAVLVAFGSWDLALAVFEGAFYERLPPWDEQEPLDRELVVLLDQLGWETGDVEFRRVETLLRAAVRAAHPSLGPVSSA